ncbi:Nuclear transport factor 2 domain containing protein [Cryptosporidium felis]|nr:Nuclear transport factor 2 domain containing protein [Cryptosporidium felis]
MVSSRQVSPQRRGSANTRSASISTRIVPFLSNYYSFLGDSPRSLPDLHTSTPNPTLKWQVPTCIFGEIPRIQGSTLLDNGMLSIKGSGRNSLLVLFSNLPTISCKVPVEIMDVNETIEGVVTVSVHGHVISGGERFLFFQVLQILQSETAFLIFNNIFYVFPVPFDLKSLQSLQSVSARPFSQTLESQACSELEGTSDFGSNEPTSQNRQIKTFPTYMDSATTTKVKPQIKIHGLPSSSSLSNKDILSAISFQLKNSNEGFAIAINRNRDEAVVQVDSTQSRDLLTQRGIYIQGLKYRVSPLNKKSNNGNHSGPRSHNSRKSSQTVEEASSKKHNQHRREVPDKDGWITVQSKNKGKFGN